MLGWIALSAFVAAVLFADEVRQNEPADVVLVGSTLLMVAFGVGALLVALLQP